MAHHEPLNSGPQHQADQADSSFRAGDVVMRREVLHGQLWMEHPVQVINVDDDEFAILLSPGSRFDFHDHPQGIHPWAAYSMWQGPEVLQIYRPELWYSVWLFFDEGRFRHWYINFEAPVERDRDGFDTDDYGLDLVITPGQAPVWKDVDHLDEMVANGRLDAAKVLGLLAAARQVANDVRLDKRWWARWDNWTPAENRQP